MDKIYRVLIGFDHKPEDMPEQRFDIGDKPKAEVLEAIGIDIKTLESSGVITLEKPTKKAVK